jgi:adenine/guanine phosphoribosyltransferase-like PRPP-binding protein
VSGGKRRVTLPVEFHRLIRQGTKVLVVEDLVSSGATVRLLTELVESLGGKIIGSAPSGAAPSAATWTARASSAS